MKCTVALLKFVTFCLNLQTDLNDFRVKPLWADRSSWWPIFHKRCVGLSEEGQQCKDKIMQALQNELND